MRWQGERRRRTEREPRGFLPRGDEAAPGWQRVRDWLLGDRDEIDQEGLLAERTLLIGPRRITGGASSDGAAEPRSQRDEARR